MRPVKFQQIHERNYSPQIIEILFKRISGDNGAGFDFKLSDEIEKEFKKERFLVCKFCRNIITSPKERIEMNGRHSHTFSNPAGITYRIGCFLYARGCINFGEPTTEYTWFPGFSWRNSFCSSCLNHLGWFYRRNGSSFYGLILMNLSENI